MTVSSHSREPSSRRREVDGAWQRFVKGEDDPSGIRPEIALSWHRSRDRYGVDPFLPAAPPGGATPAHCLEQDVVVAELGFRAAAMSHEIANVGGVALVADAAGNVLAAWGEKQTRAAAAQIGLAPWHAWSEEAVGTSGMGTALVTRRAVVVRQSEHWCEAFHNWSSCGVAIRDVVTREPVAVLGLACLGRDLPPTVRGWLDTVAAHTQNQLRGRAHHAGAELLAAYTNARARTMQPLVVVDTAGSVVIADDAASVILGVPANAPALTAAVRWTPQLPFFVRAVRYATKQAEVARDWTGTTSIGTTVSDEPATISIHPVFVQDNLVGHLISFGSFQGEQFHQAQVAGSSGGDTRRVVALREENRMLMLDASEVSVAVADGKGVWLVTDDGRLRSAHSSLDKLQEDLAGTGSFLRIHRQYLVNLSRIREVDRGEKGELVVLMSDPAGSVIPVSRRNVRELRQALHI